MSSARLRVLRAALLIPVPLVVLFALGRPYSAPGDSRGERSFPAEPARLLPVHGETFAFFNEGRAQTETGRGLFATDFFKPPPPPPAPPAPPKPPPPPPKPVPATYRGFAAFSSGAPAIAYLAIDGKVRTLSAGDTVVEGWQLHAFDADAAELARGEERLRLPFNKAVPLPAKPAK